MRRSLVVPLLCLLSASCDSPTEPAEDGALRLRTVAANTVTNHSAPGLRVVVRDAARWAVVWRQVWGEAAPSLPDVDFEHEMVILATAAPVCFGAVRIETAERAEGVLHVSLTDAGESSCLCAVPETTFHAVRARRVEGAAEFQTRSTPPRCP